MADSFPMIQQCMRHQSDYFSYYACVTCSHEVIRNDSTHIFGCAWCGTEGITPHWLQPKLVNGEIVLEKAEWCYIDLAADVR